ncbi:MAG TPA: hypothetical protein VGR11_04395 [Solirubrobacteraceae bacterium]|nr:hypothetical protein [Solirubrobacteraceae bacterium]
MDQSVEGFARRLALALNRLESSPARFEVRTAAKAANAKTPVTPTRCSIVRTHGASQSVIDVYGLATEEALVGKIRRSSLPARLLFVGGVLAIYAPRMVRVLGQRGKTARERRQVTYALGWSVLLVLTFFVLLGSLAATFASGDIPHLPKSAEGPLLAVGGLSIWKSKLFQGLADSGLVAACFLRYVHRPGDRDRALRGDFVDLLDELADREVPYKSIDVVAYSFGALTTINARFPMTDPPLDVVADINNIVTLGCPFDFVRAYWPRYFERRFGRPSSSGSWINVYSPADVLSSNFNNDELRLKPQEGVVLNGATGVSDDTSVECPRNVPYRLDGLDRPVSGWRNLMLEGFRMHGRYWDKDEPTTETVFSLIARELELGQQLLPP